MDTQTSGCKFLNLLIHSPPFYSAKTTTLSTCAPCGSGSSESEPCFSPLTSFHCHTFTQQQHTTVDRPRSRQRRRRVPPAADHLPSFPEVCLCGPEAHAAHCPRPQLPRPATRPGAYRVPSLCSRVPTTAANPSSRWSVPSVSTSRRFLVRCHFTAAQPFVFSLPMLLLTDLRKSASLNIIPQILAAGFWFGFLPGNIFRGKKKII